MYQNGTAGRCDNVTVFFTFLTMKVHRNEFKLHALAALPPGSVASVTAPLGPVWVPSPSTLAQA
jgi:hypothetical protein